MLFTFQLKVFKALRNRVAFKLAGWIDKNGMRRLVWCVACLVSIISINYIYNLILCLSFKIVKLNDQQMVWYILILSFPSFMIFFWLHRVRIKYFYFDLKLKRYIFLGFLVFFHYNVVLSFHNSPILFSKWFNLFKLCCVWLISTSTYSEVCVITDIKFFFVFSSIVQLNFKRCLMVSLRWFIIIPSFCVLSKREIFNIFFSSFLFGE